MKHPHILNCLAVTTLVFGLASSPAVARVIHGTPGDDTLRGTSKADRIVAGRGDDSIRAGAGNDLVMAGPGDDQVRGARGRDTIYTGAGSNSDPEGGCCRQRAQGDNGDDRLVGGPNDDQLEGDRGDDKLIGGPGRDSLQGGPGADVMKGGRGPDLIDAFLWNQFPAEGTSTVRVFGGPGNDLISLPDDNSRDYVDCGDGIDKIHWASGTIDDQDVIDDCELASFATSPGG